MREQWKKVCNFVGWPYEEKGGCVVRRFAPALSWAIIDKLTDETNNVKFIPDVSGRSPKGFVSIDIHNEYGKHIKTVIGIGPTNAEALIDALLKYLEGRA
ncbi:MAG: hypothetical protein JW885_02900 [Deltaproteobacteria bacterium]|nr:hypothetical protein [Candidatus Zymogenaceae bacterium]